MAEQYSSSMYHHPCRVFIDYLQKGVKTKAMTELFYASLFAYFNFKSTGVEFYVQCPETDPPDAKMVTPHTINGNLAYRDIEIFVVKDFKSEEDILEKTQKKMHNKKYGEHVVLIGILEPKQTGPFDIYGLEDLFKSVKFTLHHVFFIFPTVELRAGTIILKYVLVQVQPVFNIMIVERDELTKTCNAMTGGFFYELAGRGKPSLKNINKDEVPVLIPPSKR